MFFNKKKKVDLAHRTDLDKNAILQKSREEERNVN